MRGQLSQAIQIAVFSRLKSESPTAIPALGFLSSACFAKQPVHGLPCALQASSSLMMTGLSWHKALPIDVGKLTGNT
ncbi:MAG: hypothetical protein K1566_14770 [Candidatus Thiodiazotropha sp. (ex. Lucinisca nassula)]|nr:hypothetical protein [Candidatus Thiodiazotropha sp. (ex. Lucinisca nassula)]MBW9262325.1 hypothetical protein [Candidatus Thiodiazotropha sp. (ex. Lucinisca nassula)]MBW9270902.1 hypothetical protein [Candidatus Thiodiazotropha sp. (ex. Lucinisca nassula)]